MAWQLMESEIFGRFQVCDLPASGRQAFFRAAAAECVAGGRVYDAHIAEAARLAGATAVVTDNPRHFAPLARHAVPVLSAREFADRHAL